MLNCKTAGLLCSSSIKYKFLKDWTAMVLGLIKIFTQTLTHPYPFLLKTSALHQ